MKKYTILCALAALAALRALDAQSVGGGITQRPTLDIIQNPAANVSLALSGHTISIGNMTFLTSGDLTFTGNVGIGASADPGSPLCVGSSCQFNIDSSGDVNANAYIAANNFGLGGYGFLQVPNTSGIAFSSTGGWSGSKDAGLSRSAAGIVAVGNGSQGDFSAALEANNLLVAKGTAIASASTIAPTTGVVHITGTTAIATITAPTSCTTSGTACQITLIPDGAFTTTTAGNIALASTAVVSKAMVMTYDAGAAKWYPSY